MNIKGFHHITMNCKDAVENVAFYRDFLGIHMVKQTVNFDDPFTYHLYYADKEGSPGTLLTFFPFQGIPRSTHGNNEIRSLAFAIQEDEYELWKEKLQKKEINFSEEIIFSQKVLAFQDPDGLELELVVTQSDLPNLIKRENLSLKGLHSISLHVPFTNFIIPLLEAFQYKKIKEEKNRMRFSANQQNSFIDILLSTEQHSSFGFGSVHHLAFHIPDEELLETRAKIKELGYHITSVIDRQYFKSLYFRTHEQILFEIATTGPGMFVDEEELGKELQIPKQHKHIEQEIKMRLKTL